MLKIKAFGRDREFTSVQALKNALAQEYRGQSVSIVYAAKPRGLLRAIFVDVSGDGKVNESYGSRRVVDFEVIEDARI